MKEEADLDRTSQSLYDLTLFEWILQVNLPQQVAGIHRHLLHRLTLRLRTISVWSSGERSGAASEGVCLEFHLSGGPTLPPPALHMETSSVLLMHVHLRWELSSAAQQVEKTTHTPRPARGYDPWQARNHAPPPPGQVVFLHGDKRPPAFSWPVNTWLYSSALISSHDGISDVPSGYTFIPNRL